MEDYDDLNLSTCPDFTYLQIDDHKNHLQQKNFENYEGRELTGESLLSFA